MGQSALKFYRFITTLMLVVRYLKLNGTVYATRTTCSLCIPGFHLRDLGMM